MQKIMFNDKYGLTQAILEGRKTMTRRIIDIPDECSVECVEMPDGDRLSHITKKGCRDVELKNGVILKNSYMPLVPKYKIGEVVAVAQSYKEIASDPYFISQCAANEQSVNDMMLEKGWNNKMFVAAYYMPHHIRITDIRCERLQEISDEDCLKEGVIHYDDIIGEGYMLAEPYNNSYRRHCFTTPRKAFATLIDKVSGKGTWERNPWVFVYEFEKVD